MEESININISFENSFAVEEALAFTNELFKNELKKDSYSKEFLQSIEKFLTITADINFAATSDNVGSKVVITYDDSDDASENEGKGAQD